MDQVLEHLKEYYIAYALVAICLFPILYLTRRYSAPIIQYTIEIVLYLLCIHVALWLLVVVTKWFKEQSTMRVLADGSPEPPPDWRIPLLEFWDREQFAPAWLFWVEIAAVVIVVGLVWRYRPLRIQKQRKWRFSEKNAKKAGGTAMSRPGGKGKGMPGRGGRR